MWLIKGVLIKKEIDKHNYKIPSSFSINNIKKMHFAELLISSADYK